jgi:hypothetical protein
MSISETDVPQPEPAPEPPPPEEPAPEGEPEPEEPSAWSGPSREEWERTQATLAQAEELLGYLQTPAPVEQAQPELPTFDPFDPDSVQAYTQANNELLRRQVREDMQAMFAPIVEREQNEAASQWAEDTLGRLGVPDDEVWQEAVLFASAGYQQYDEYGRPLVHPQQAAAKSYQLLQKFADQIRSEERERMAKGQADQDEALRNRAGAPDLPSGPAGGEGFPEGMDEIQAARMWRERQSA